MGARGLYTAPQNPLSVARQHEGDKCRLPGITHDNEWHLGEARAQQPLAEVNFLTALKVVRVHRRSRCHFGPLMRHCQRFELLRQSIVLILFVGTC